MNMKKIKEFITGHKTEIICSAVIGASSIVLGVAGFEMRRRFAYKKIKPEDRWFIQLCKDFDEASRGCDAYVLATPKNLWSAFDSDGNLVDSLRDPDGNLINPKMLMVFGEGVKK